MVDSSKLRVAGTIIRPTAIVNQSFETPFPD